MLEFLDQNCDFWRHLASRRYNIVLADRATGVVRRFTISLWPTLGVVAGVLAMPVLIGFGARWSARSTVAELERSNIALTIENASYREATGELADQISSLQAAVDSLGIQLFPPGSGGPHVPAVARPAAGGIRVPPEAQG